ncbi:hypothetical protein GHV40_12615 [Devosia sp. D6-9]|nr:hypothetical protein GHV40_12615 [Devosia sp. D6-9]
METWGTMADVKGAVLAPAAEARDFAPVLRWILLNAMVAIALLALWHFGLVQAMFATDHTRISLIILAIFAFTALACLYQTVVTSQELVAARKAREIIAKARMPGFRVTSEGVTTADGQLLPPGTLTTHIGNLVIKAEKQNGGHIDQTLLLRALADRLRSREKLGWFISEALLRLALLGTAIGFILMLLPIAQITSFDAETLRPALTGMTGGMAIALNVTVTGIATALVLKLEYYFLNKAIAELFDLVTEITEIYVIPTLEQGSNGER